jgi:hypothetical protein
LSFLEKFLAIDRRYIFIVVGIAVIIPFLIPLKLGVTESPPVKHVYDFIEAIPEGTDKPILVSFDYDPSTQPELSPMAVAILTHCFRRDIPVIVTSLHPGGPGLALDVSATVSEDMGKKYGEDYVFLGYKAGSSAVMLAMGEDIRLAFPTDYWGTPVEELPLMDNVVNYNDVHIVITLSGSTFPEAWVVFAHERYGVALASGVTAVMAADYYPFLQTGQMVGLLGGLKGAAEYEKLIDYEGMYGEPGNGMKGMDAQTVIHVFIVVIVIFGNIAYIIILRRQRRELVQST